MSDYSLEIHHLDVHGGDSTAIVVRDMTKAVEAGGKIIYRMLIDAGAEGSGSSALKHYLQTYLPGPFDLIVATHYHKDHIQGFAAAGIVFKQFLDNGGYQDGLKNVFTPTNDIGTGSRTGIFNDYQACVQKGISGTTPTRVPIPFIEKGFTGKAVPLEIKLGEETGIKMICYCANGILADGTNVLKKQKNTKAKSINPNDVSLAFVLEWGDFRYFTAGDLSGDPTQSKYYDIEKELVDYLTKGPLKDKPITVFKASHHGSEHSNQKSLFDKLKPDSVIVCCNIPKHVPSPVFLGRLKEYFKPDKSPNVVFSNAMKVFKNDDRYEPLVALKDFIVPGNVIFEEDDNKNKSASNLGIKSVVIRRRVKDGRMITLEMPHRAEAQLSKPDLGYDIVLLERDANDAKNISATFKFTNYDMKLAWDAKQVPRSSVLKGLNDQAKAMAGWLKTDAENLATEGNDYIVEHYPALVETVNKLTEHGTATVDDATKDLSEKMISLFDQRYIEKGGLIQPTLNTLSNDEKMTLFRLLKDNYHQVALNYLLEKGKYDRDRNAWNSPSGYTPEPHPIKEGIMRPRGYELDDRQDEAKRRKTIGDI